MRVLIASCLVLGALCLSACGSDSSGGGGSDAGGASGGSAGAGASGGSSSGGSAGSTGGSAGTGTGGSAGSTGTTACGPSLVCAQYSVCIVDEFAPACTPKVDDAGPCPTGQTETLCGGIGTPCCCEPPPPSEYRCEGKGICGAKPDCDCLGPTICHNGQMCMAIAGKDWEFHCSDPPVP